MSDAFYFGSVIGAALLILLIGWWMRRTLLKRLESFWGWVAGIAAATGGAVILSIGVGMQSESTRIYAGVGGGLLALLLYGIGGYRLVKFVASKFMDRKYAILLGGILPAALSIPTVFLVPGGIASLVAMVRALGRVPDHLEQPGHSQATPAKDRRTEPH